MRRASPLSPLEQLHLTPRRHKLICVALRAWMELDPLTLHSEAFNAPVVAVLGALLTDHDYMLDFIANHDRRANISLSVKVRQIQYVVLHWLADLACGVGR